MNIKNIAIIIQEYIYIYIYIYICVCVCVYMIFNRTGLERVGVVEPDLD